MKAINLSTLIKRYIRLALVKIGAIREGHRLWYYYLPTDEFIDLSENRDKPQDVIRRGDRYGVKHKNYDILRRGLFSKDAAQELVDLEHRYYTSGPEQVTKCAVKVVSTGEHCPETGIHKIDGTDEYLCERCYENWMRTHNTQKCN